MSGLIARLGPRPCGFGWNVHYARSKSSGGSYFYRREPRTVLKVGDLRTSITARMSPVRQRVESLREQLYRRWVYLEEDWGDKVCARLQELGDAALPMLVEEMNEQRVPAMRYINTRAARLLGWSANEKAVQPLCDILKVGQKKVVEEAIDSLITLDDPKAGVPLLEALQNISSSSSHVRYAIVCVLGKWRIQESVEPLIGMLMNRQLPQTQQEAIMDALTDIGDVRAIDPLIRKLRAPNRSDPIARAAAKALVRFGEKARVPLKRALQDPDILNRQRKRITNALTDIG